MLRWLTRSDAASETEPDAPYALRDGEEARLPIHVLADEARLAIENGLLRVDSAEDDRTLRIDEISLVAVHGGASATFPCLAALADAGVPVVLHSRRGYYRGQIVDLSANQAAVRRAQYAAARDRKLSLAIARPLVVTKIDASARLVRRRLGGRDPACKRLRREAAAAGRAGSLERLRGVEGAAAACWYDAWPRLLRSDEALFVFGGRTRRPPQDAVNALLSYLYAVLAGNAAAAALGAGLDPTVGFLHAERPGRPALALDLLEPLRVAVADAAVLAAINNGEFDEEDFEFQADGAVRLSDSGRRTALAALERRLSTALVYDGAETSWRGAIVSHALILARHLRAGSGRAPPPPPAPG